MAQDQFKRKLTTIFSADVAGYSRLMGEDEAVTVKTLEQYKGIMSELIRQHRGRVIDSPGDNLLAEFTSVVDAVQCAVATQKELQARNAELPEHRRMQFRIGINLGDVIEEESRIYGDGVNIAARLESLADPGGICISKTAFDQIETKLPFGYAYLGEQTVKNIVKPVGAYKVLMEPRVVVARAAEKKLHVFAWGRKGWLAGALAVLICIIGIAVWNFYFRLPFIEPASEKKMAFPLPDKPSIAVLPFANMSDNPNQEYFSDGLAEEIITALSKVPQLFVIARNSTFSFKGKSVKVNQITEELGVRYVLEGSVRKEGERVRITAQLIDALTGHHLWAERYDRGLKDVFALQDEITMKVLTALQVRLTDGEVARISAKGTQKLEAYLKVMQARGPFYTYTKEGFAQARLLCEEALAIDPDYAAAYVYLGSTHFMDVILGSSKSPKESMALAFECMTKAKALDDSYAAAHSILGFIFVMKKQYDRGIDECKRAIAVEPNSAIAYTWMSLVLINSGNHQEAVQPAEHALRLDPLAPQHWNRILGMAYSGVGRYQEAISALKKALQRAPDDIITHIELTKTYSWAGRMEEARAQAKEVLRINPRYCLEQDARASLFKNQTDREQYLDGLQKAGLPKHPPLPLPEKPSIAVLPFVNMSDDPQQEYFSDGITDDLITDLSKVSGLMVISRNSTFTYKGKPVQIKNVAQELGVKYVLEGSVRKVGDQIRINAQLIDAAKNNHVWAERYDGKMGDIFALQDKITRKIISALALRLTASEQKFLTDKGTENLQAYDEFLKGWQGYRLQTKEGFAEAKIHFEKAVEIDPEFARAYAAQAVMYQKAIQMAAPGLRQGLGVTSNAALNAIRTKPQFLVKKAMKKPTALAHGLMSQFYLFRWQHDEALAEIERAVAMDPNDPELYNWMSNILWFMGKNREAIESAKMGLRLEPTNPAAYLLQLAKAYLPDGNLKESSELLERVIRLNPDLTGSAALIQSIIYGIYGQNEEARTAYEIFLKSRMSPVRGLKNIILYFPFSDPNTMDSFAVALIKAGVPGSPTDYDRLSRENMINGQEVKSLLFGHKVTGTSWATGEQLSGEWSKSGEFKFTQGSHQDTGISWVEGDVLLIQFEKLYGGFPFGMTIFRNPDGSREGKNEFFMVSDLRSITPFSPTE